MPILNIQTNQVGQSGIFPAIIFILTNDTLTEVTAPGYLNGVVQKFGVQLSEADIALVTTKTSPNARSTQVGWCSVIETNGNWGLTIPTSSAVILPTIPNHIATYTNTQGQLSEDPATAFSNGNIQAGSSGTAGAFISFPTLNNNGSFKIAADNAGGPFDTTISTGTVNQSTVYTLGDIGTATGGIPVATTPIRFKVGSANILGGLSNNLITDAFCTNISTVIGAFKSQTNGVSILTINPGNGSFVLTTTAPGPGDCIFRYIIIK